MSDLGTRLRAAGRRLTPQRQQVLAAVEELGHATPEQIVEAVSTEGETPMALSTVYRSLEALQDLGLVSHTHVDHRVPSYHLTSHATHIHVVCRQCGSVGEAPIAVAEEFVARLDSSLGFEADVTHAAIHGLCRTCRKQS
ncbi:Fur family transcriptional regulator [Knoellia sinensis KCTC 19936]|uniref:Fur family transcriptional regulator n=1 Tax=Knoellia sinensis KCTC 19936 TaxID=1385520 RepID=A0A0A0JB01_9MICO|nr:Fur family transcriptional regulator [Knoellia sinensis KCTC 19936]